MITKEEVLKRYSVGSLASIKDEDLIQLAEEGALGNDTMWSATMLWVFPSKSVFAEHLRKAIESGKEVRITFIEGEHLSKDEIKVELI